MNEQTIIDLRTELNTLAQAIYDDKILMSQKISEKKTTENQIAASQAYYLQVVLTARFAINNQLQYTNDDARKSAMTEMLANDPLHQGFLQTQQLQSEAIAVFAAEIEKNSNARKASELLMLFYANRQDGAFVPTNLFIDADTASGEYLGTNGIITNSNQAYKNSGYIAVIPNGNYYLNGIRGKTGIAFFSDNQGTIVAGSFDNGNTPLIKTAPAAAAFCKFTLAQPSAPVYQNIIFAAIE